MSGTKILAHSISVGDGAQTSSPGIARKCSTRAPDHFVLRGPRERKEGGNSTRTPSADSVPSENSTSRLTNRLLPREVPEARPEQELPDKASDLEPHSPPKNRKIFIHQAYLAN